MTLGVVKKINGSLVFSDTYTWQKFTSNTCFIYFRRSTKEKNQACPDGLPVMASTVLGKIVAFHCV